MKFFYRSFLKFFIFMETGKKKSFNHTLPIILSLHFIVYPNLNRSHTEKSYIDSYWIKRNLDFNYTFAIDLAPNRIPFGSN